MPKVMKANLTDEAAPVEGQRQRDGNTLETSLPTKSNFCHFNQAKHVLRESYCWLGQGFVG